MKFSDELKEGVKELLRTALMAVVPLLVVDFQGGKFDFKALGVAGLIAFLSGLDKWLHEKDSGVRGNGLTGF